MTTTDIPPVMKQGSYLGWVRLLLVCLASFTDIANLGMCNIALPSIAQDLNLGPGELQWVLTAYALTFGGFLLVGGRLGSIFGIRRVFKVGLFLFMAFSILCAAVKQPVAFLVGRALQGIAAALTIPTGQASLKSFFPSPDQHHISLAVWGASGATGFVLGPIIGGLFEGTQGWRWIFWFTTILTGALFVISLFLLRTPQEDKVVFKKSAVEQFRTLDAFGCLLSLAGFVLLTYALTSGESEGWGSPAIISTLILSVVLILFFVLVEWKVSKNPLIPRAVIRRGNAATGCALGAFTYAVWQGINYILTLELQDFGFTALETAVRFLPLGGVALATNFVAPFIIKRTGARPVFIAGWVVTIVGVVLLSVMSSKDEYAKYCIPGMILFMAGVNSVFYAANVEVIGGAPADDQATIAGIFNMSLQMGGSVLGFAIVTLVRTAVEDNAGGSESARARLKGYRAGHYTILAMSGTAAALSALLVSSSKATQASEVQESENEGESVSTKV
ncbi:MFS transporter [Phlyctema vagabunda]|uniref:MFS transporter n=1 Tax=Phlyctema vagabunda TaxID=108571 RepID=A0ABR4PE19_9HELO